MKADQKFFEKKTKADQAAILKRAEQTEENLEAAQHELTGLKKHVSNMTTAMFAIHRVHGDDQGSDGQQGTSDDHQADARLPVYIASSDRGIKKISRPKGSVEHPESVLSVRPELKTEEIAAGYPELKDDGSEFTEVDYHRTIVESRYAATQLAASLDLNKYQATYDEAKNKVTPPSYETSSLVPSRPKNPFDLDMDLSLFLDDEDEFVALSECNWKLGDLRIEGGESSRQGDSAAA
ncbi:hypothetical protein ZWY2020_049170 [Hordeum vulgare]|nr:hypothetical protein ZWY2020_049170 [Hordeum vulgare]